MLGKRVGAHGLAPSGASQRGIEVILLLLQHEERQRRGGRVPCLHLVGGMDRRHVIAGEEARLELSSPVVAFQEGEGGMTRCTLLEGALGEPTIVEAAEFRGPSTQHPHECERRGKSVEEESELLHELQSVLGLALDLIEWMARGKKNGIETARGNCGKCRVAVLLCHLGGATRRTSNAKASSCRRSQASSGSSVVPAMKYVSAEAYADDALARLPAARFSSASCSRSSCDVISAMPRLSWLTISKIAS